MAEIVLLGGPYDGHVHRSGITAPFLWFDGRKVWRSPGRRRVLYRKTSAESAGLVIVRLRYSFAGNTTALCVCGVYRPKDGRCSFCGSTELA